MGQNCKNIPERIIARFVLDNIQTNWRAAQTTKCDPSKSVWHETSLILFFLLLHSFSFLCPFPFRFLSCVLFLGCFIRHSSLKAKPQIEFVIFGCCWLTYNSSRWFIRSIKNFVAQAHTMDCVGMQLCVSIPSSNSYARATEINWSRMLSDRWGNRAEEKKPATSRPNNYR